MWIRAFSLLVLGVLVGCAGEAPPEADTVDAPVEQRFADSDLGDGDRTEVERHLPADLWIPRDAVLTRGRTTRVRVDDELVSAVDASFVTGQDFDAVAETYRERLVEEGWTIRLDRTRDDGSVRIRFDREGADAELQLTVSDDGTDVRLRVRPRR